MEWHGLMTINRNALSRKTLPTQTTTPNNDQGGGGVFNIGGTLDIDNAASSRSNLATANNGNGGGVMTVGGVVTIDDTTIAG